MNEWKRLRSRRLTLWSDLFEICSESNALFWLTIYYILAPFAATEIHLLFFVPLMQLSIWMFMEFQAVYFCTFLSSKVGKLSFVETIFDFYFRFQSWNQLSSGAQCTEICCLGNCVMKCLISIEVRSQSIDIKGSAHKSCGWASGWSYLMRRKGSKASQPNASSSLFIPV